MFLQIQDEDLAGSLGLATGQYLVKQTAGSRQRSKKRVRKSHIGQNSLTRPTNAGDKMCVSSDPDVISNDLAELMDTQKLMEFPITSTNPKDITDFESTQILQSNYLEGPVIAIADYPEISAGRSAAENEMFLYCMEQSAAEDLPVMSESTARSLAVRQSPVVTSAAETHATTLAFPLTLAVDESSLDNCSPLQFLPPSAVR